MTSLQVRRVIGASERKPVHPCRMINDYGSCAACYNPECRFQRGRRWPWIKASCSRQLPGTVDGHGCRRPTSTSKIEVTA